MDKPSQKEVLGSELPRTGPRINLVTAFVPLTCAHLDSVFQIAAASFPTVWSEKDFAYFLAHENRLSVGLVSQSEGKQRLRAYFLALLVQGDLDIISIATDPACRRLGLAYDLLSHVCAEPRVQRCFLEVETENSGAIGLYQKAGFHILGRRPAYYGSGRDAYLMRWLKKH